MVRIGAIFLLSALPLSLLGCKAEEERLVPVEGTVTFNGAALPAGMVVFQPDKDKGNLTREEPRAKIDAQGRYALESRKGTGAPLGWYKVVVFPMKETTPQNPNMPPVWLAPQRYTDSKTSNLALEVVDSPAAKAYDLLLDP